MDLKTLGRFRQKTIKQRTRLKIQMTLLSHLLVTASHRNFSAKYTRMSKRDSRVLRYALVYAAHNVGENNATFKAYYDAKMAEDRTHYNALWHCAGKLVRISSRTY